jgi:hypothetical protein
MTSKERELRVSYKNILEVHKTKIKKDCEQEMFSKVKAAENEIKIGKADLAREKSQTNVFRASWEERLKKVEKKLKLKEKDLDKKARLVDVESRKLMAYQDVYA